MIRATHLIKRFSGLTAVDDLSFEVERGQITGLLGPNGAGKTTLLRMLTGFLTPTSGEIVIAGRSIRESSLDIRRRVGYLPENCPLYPEMRVDEYLSYRAALKGVPARDIRNQVADSREKCGLADAGKRIIGQLSKGYRQRVGLADALVHDPDLLILDEPTVGLDPNQIREVRELILHLSDRHTILLSTHILPEVEAICRRVLILDRGRLILSDSSENMRRFHAGGCRVYFEMEALEADLRAELAAWPGGELQLRPTDGRWLAGSLNWTGEEDPRPELFRRAAARGWTLREIRVERYSLEDVFVSLTTRETAGGGT